MSPRSEFAAELQAALVGELESDGDQALCSFLEAHGFSFAARSATNLRLLAYIFPADGLTAIVTAALKTAQPDMALNGLERISSVLPREELLEICTKRTRVAQLITICGASPFLITIICRDPSALLLLFTARKIELRRDMDDMLSVLRAVTANADYAEIFSILRRFKYREILRIAARDLNGLAPLEEVTAELSDLAAACVQVAYEKAREKLIAEHGRPMMETETGEREAELTVLGMGKFGGRELNFSSDIDIIYFYSSDQGETTGITDGNGGSKGRISLHAFFVKLAEMVSKAISQVTEDGFVFRVDLGLRPEGKSGDVATSVRAAEIYYESWGQSWERSAMLKARPVAGSLALGEQLLKALEPFIYRKYLDYNLIEDMMAMKKKIDASLAREREGEYNIKLGRGGIREVEFFIQALQLVYAGKNPALRERNSLKALEVLKDARFVKEDDCSGLAEAYRFLRTVEHRIQVVQERQTHSLPKKEDEFKALARRCGFLRENGVVRFSETLEQHRSKVSEVYSGLFLSRDEKLREEVAPEVYFFFDRKADSDLIKDMLEERHFTDVDAAYENLVILRDGPPRAHLTERARRTLEKIAPLLLQEILASPVPDMALGNLERFLTSVGTRSSVYALLAENTETLKLMVSLFGMSEFLSKIFIGHPELLESMVSTSYAFFYKEKEAMAQELAGLLDNAEDFEEKLDLLRRYRNSEFLRIGVNDIYSKIGQTEIASQLTALADVCVEAACSMARDELKRYGRPLWKGADGQEREASLAIVGMGKLGGNELNYHSDLDIIYVYDHQGITDGEKQLTNHEYFAKLGQKIISILSTQTREGYVYKLDTRLRPSGNAGPLVASLDSFKAYHREEAQIWERQALTKARVVYGEESLQEGIQEVIRHAAYGTAVDDEARSEINRLRIRMENEIAKERAGHYNIKTGRGGMVDVEFIVQYLLLRYGKDYPEIRSTGTLTSLKAIRSEGLIEEQDFEPLLHGYKFLRRLENRLRIIHDYSMNDLGGPQDYLDKLARRLGGYDPKLRHPGNALLAEYEKTTEAVRAVYQKILGDYPAEKSGA